LKGKGDAADAAVKVDRLHQWHGRSGRGECAQVSGQTRVVERPSRATPAPVFTQKVTRHVPVVLQLVEIAIDSAAREPATKRSHEFRGAQASAVCRQSDCDGDLDSIHAHPDQRVEAGRKRGI
jgi:hypothetical protein